MALLVVTQIALILTLLTGYRPSFFPPGMEKRSIGFGAATAQILVDSPSSALADLSRDTAPLATRALVFTQFMSSFSFKESIAQAAGLHGEADHHGRAVHANRHPTERRADARAARRPRRRESVPARVRRSRSASGNQRVRAGAYGKGGACASQRRCDRSSTLRRQAPSERPAADI